MICGCCCPQQKEKNDFYKSQSEVIDKNNLHNQPTKTIYYKPTVAFTFNNLRTDTTEHVLALKKIWNFQQLKEPSVKQADTIDYQLVFGTKPWLK